MKLYEQLNMCKFYVLLFDCFSFAAARRVCRKTNHYVGDRALVVKLLEVVENVESCTVEVTGITSAISLDHLMLYFESTKACAGGGIIKEIFMDSENGRAVLTYQNSRGFYKSNNNIQIN